MKAIRLLLLSMADEPSPWMIVSRSGDIIARGLVSPGDPPPAEAAAAVVVVPGEDVLLRWLETPGRHPAQSNAAAAWLLREEIGQPGDQVRFVVGPGAAGAPRLVAATARTVLDAWVDRVGALGLRTRAIVPDSLLVPAPSEPGELNALRMGDRILVRGADFALSGEPALAEAVAAARPLRYVAGPEGLEALMVRLALSPEIDLAGDRAARAAPARAWSRPVALAAALALTPLVHIAAAAGRDDYAARRMQAESVAAVQAAFPGAGPTESPLTALRRHGADDPFSGGAVSAAAALAHAVQSVGQTRLEALTVDAGTVRATVSYDAAPDLEALIVALKAHHVAASVEGSLEDEGRLTADLRLRRPG